MSLFDTSRPAAGLTAGGFSGFAQRISAALHNWKDARVTYNQLSALTPRELDDIGLTRGDIADVARGARRV